METLRWGVRAQSLEFWVLGWVLATPWGLICCMRILLVRVKASKVMFTRRKNLVKCGLCF